jgi:glycosyltransferase involved in cell wall biosynthesis
LERLRIPYMHIGQQPYQKVALLYQALDVYLVTSRQEGGPKAVLESLISGIPLVTTQVGQAIDLIQHGMNGWMVPVNDVESLAFWVNYVHENYGPSISKVLSNGKATAEMNAYSAQLGLWRNFMDGFVDF